MTTWMVIAARAATDGCHPVICPYRKGADGLTDLDHALDDARQIASPDRTWVATLEAHRPWWDHSVRAHPGVHVIEQPLDRGTGPAVALALVRIREVDPTATVIVWTLSCGLRPRIEAANALLSAVAVSKDVVAARSAAAGPVCELISALQKVYPELSEQIEGFIGSGDDSLDAFYPFLDFVDFQRDIVARDPRTLARSIARSAA